jgi:WD40 repeat protein
VGDAAATVGASETPAQAGITAIKTRIAELRARDAEALEQIQRGEEQIQRAQRVRGEIDVEMTQATAELDALVAAPVPAGVDPTAWLPDELLILILLQVGWRRGCDAVCRRWHGLCQDVAVKRQLRAGRWEEYAAGRIEPRPCQGHYEDICCLAVGPNGKVYSGSVGSRDFLVRVWSTRDGQLLQTLEGHNGHLFSLAVAQDGTLYSASFDGTVRAWSGETGIHLRTLTGHIRAVSALAIGANGNVLSGSWDRTVKVWSGRDGTHLRTLRGHTAIVCALVANRDKVYSSSKDATIRVWSATDGAHLQTLTGHTGTVGTVALGPDGNLFSGSNDGTVRVWCGNDGAHLRTLHGDRGGVHALAVGRDNRLFVGGGTSVQVWQEMGSASRCTVVRDFEPKSARMCLSAAGTLYAGWRDEPYADEFTQAFHIQVL